MLGKKAAQHPFLSISQIFRPDKYIHSLKAHPAIIRSQAMFLLSSKFVDRLRARPIVMLDWPVEYISLADLLENQITIIHLTLFLTVIGDMRHLSLRVLPIPRIRRARPHRGGGFFFFEVLVLYRSLAVKSWALLMKTIKNQWWSIKKNLYFNKSH